MMRNTNPDAATAAMYRELLLAKRAKLIAELRGQFLELVEELTRVAGEFVELLQELARAAEEDSAPILRGTYVMERLSGLDGKELQAVDAALERLELGTYGICQRCGETIPAERLMALPWASQCILCERRL